MAGTVRRAVTGGDVWIVATFLAVLPLLPSGTSHLGLSAPFLVDFWVAALVVAWLSMRVARPVRQRAPAAATIFRAWAAFLIVAAGAMVVGLAAENRVGSPVFAAHLADVHVRVLQPLDFTTDPFYSIRTLITLLEGFVVFAVLRDWSARVASAEQFVTFAGWGWLSGLALTSIIALIQFVGRFHLQPLFTKNPFLVRVQSTLDDPNALAAYLTLGVGMACGIACSTPRRRSAMLALGIAVTAALAVLTTASRVAVVALPLAVLIVIGCLPMSGFLTQMPRFAVLQRAARQLLLVFGAIVVALLLARVVATSRTPPMPQSAIEAVTQAIDPRTPVDEIFKGRLVYWRAATRMAAEHPLTGVGLGRYPRLAPGFRSAWVPLDNVHNFFLQMLAEAGIFGFLAFTNLYLVTLMLLYRAAASRDAARAGLAFGGVIGQLGFALTLLTGHALALPSGQALWGSALAIVVAGALPAAASAQAARLSKTRWIVGTVAVFVVTAATVARTHSPPAITDRWGYSWGLYPEEAGFFPAAWDLPTPDADAAEGPPNTQSARFRWTGAHVLMELRPPPGARECVFAFAAALPYYSGAAQTVVISAGRAEQTLVLKTSDLQILRIPLDLDSIDDQGRLLVEIAVDSTFEPSSLRLSSDTRTLGMQIFEPRYR